MNDIWPGSSSGPGIASRHRFSAGPYYDPANLGLGPVIGFDEHTVEPGAGFDWHAHRGVHILSWVLEGELQHEGEDRAKLFVPPGMLLIQSTGDGIRHRETNALDDQTLRFLQITILRDGPVGVRVQRPPIMVAGVFITTGSRQVDDGRGALVHDIGDGKRLTLEFDSPSGPTVEG